MKELQKTRRSLLGEYAPHQAGVPFLEVTGLSLRYETGAALEEVTFSVQAGARVAVVGPNGAGKSTLFKIISGVLEPTSGQVRISGQADPGRHICIAYLPQRSQVDWSFPVSVADVVMMGRVGRLGLLKWPRRKDWEFVRQALADVGMADLAGRQIGELSGGQQQRMFIARALAQEAELMLMDEPLTGLDVNSQRDIFNILDELRRRQVTVLVATHDLDQAAERFDQVMLLNHRLVAFGLPAEVITPAHLLSAYGGHLHMLQDQDHLVALGDTCCNDGEEEL